MTFLSACILTLNRDSRRTVISDSLRATVDIQRSNTQCYDTLVAALSQNLQVAEITGRVFTQMRADCKLFVAERDDSRAHNRDLNGQIASLESELKAMRALVVAVTKKRDAVEDEIVVFHTKHVLQRADWEHERGVLLAEYAVLFERFADTSDALIGSLNVTSSLDWPVLSPEAPIIQHQLYQGARRLKAVFKFANLGTNRVFRRRHPLTERPSPYDKFV